MHLFITEKEARVFVQLQKNFTNALAYFSILSVMSEKRCFIAMTPDPGSTGLLSGSPSGQGLTDESANQSNHSKS